MKKALIGAGGSAREIRAHIKYDDEKWLPCFVDDEYWVENNNNIFPLSQFDPNEYAVLVTLGDPKDKFNIIQKLPKETKYFSYICYSAQLLGYSDGNIKIGDGTFIGANCLLTCDIKIGNHVLLNRGAQIGHDCTIGDYSSIMPGGIISGNCTIGDSVYIGTNSSIKEKINIHSSSIIGLNTGVIKNITEPGTYIGTPAKKIK